MLCSMFHREVAILYSKQLGGVKRLTQKFSLQMPIKRNRLGISVSEHLSHLGVERNCLQYASVVVKRFSMVWCDELERGGESQNKEGRK
jgi:hypothetical protein